MPLEGTTFLASFGGVGSSGNASFFGWDSLTDTIVISPLTYTSNTSLTYAPTGRNASLTLLDFGLQPVTFAGPLAYERFNFSDTFLYGQGFLLPTESQFYNSFLGFRLGQGNLTNSWGFPTFIDSMWQQGLIEHRLISFAYSLDMPLNQSGNVTIGAISEGISPEALTNYTVNINNGDWAFSLTDMQWGDLSLGFNGYLTITTLSIFSVVPMPVFTTLMALIGPPPSYRANLEGIIYVFYNNTLFPDLSALPNITLYLHHQPLVLTAFQYMICGYAPDLCIFSFGGASNVYPYKAAFTLGSLTLNGTYAVFDLEQKTFGMALMNTLLGPI